MAKANKKKNNKAVKPAVQNQAAAENLTDEQVVEAPETQEMAAEAAPQTEKQVEKQPAKVEKKDKNQKAKAQKQPNPKQNKVKETVAELKKVTWPTFPKVVKNTLLVLVIVLISTAVLLGIDYVLSLLYKLLTPAA